MKGLQCPNCQGDGWYVDARNRRKPCDRKTMAIPAPPGQPRNRRTMYVPLPPLPDYNTDREKIAAAEEPQAAPAPGRGPTPRP